MNAYPYEPGYRQRDTSKAAADAIAPRAWTLRERVYQSILAKPGTADEVAARIGEKPGSVRPRTTELTLDGRIYDTGQRRPAESGRMQIVYAATRSASQKVAA